MALPFPPALKARLSIDIEEVAILEQIPPDVPDILGLLPGK